MSVIVLNASYEPLHTVSIQHAIRMLVREVAVVEESHGERTIGPFPVPRVLRLVRYVVTHWRYAAGRMKYSKHGVLRRDKFRCAYCGLENADTMDHVQPRSRGGRTEWLNAVAAHASCNERKGNRTPSEAGMPLLWQPWVPTRAELVIDT
ncbi:MULTISPECIES: HNH endonuclease [Kribbella]|jgi:5-methylcytosine-specific restriction endonuclease McrA|uniref:5-methylcytosine-specific restriction endonuclease McrA n=3 Tax=Actinomycetes TaxID=1760 RepID=A0ABY2FD32_9ACTN|nr:MULTISPECIES: HNH endonuclease [Kribbella]TCC11389.1 HNH endonuclease [Kribbella soli]TDO62709.1 5-methylcytosine-specific restriction endonuclease McrA [Kribbella sp. VKM Ac-2571]TDW81197.1 5-methylcytosine-specific restriction endonuclease McrA [Kribbella sp. VKM Ac-2566]TDW89254.1 5-methylcytosine-specific restriction endonuclease McrA [Kribbella pratensis]